MAKKGEKGEEAPLQHYAAVAELYAVRKFHVEWEAHEKTCKILRDLNYRLPTVGRCDQSAPFSGMPLTFGKEWHTWACRVEKRPFRMKRFGETRTTGEWRTHHQSL